MNKDYFHNPIWSYLINKEAEFILNQISGKLSGLNSNGKLYLLNLGCGSGSIEYLLKKILKFPAHIISLDISNEACKNSQNISADNLIINADMKTLPIKDNSIDCILFINSYHHIPKVYRNTLMKEVTRVIKDDGQVIMLEPIESIWKKLAKFFFQRKWHSVHTKEERLLDKEDLKFIYSFKNFKNHIFAPFVFIFDPLLFIKFPYSIKKLFIRLQFIDTFFIRLGMKWNCWISFEVEKINK